MRHKISRFSSGAAVFFLFASVLLVMGCKPQTQQLEIAAVYQGEKLGCEIKQKQSDWQINTLRFFLSDLALLHEGQWHPATLPSSDWQTDSVSLISVLTPECQEQQLNNRLVFISDIDLEDAQGIKISLGVPFDVNHLNPLQQPSPLNLPAMFWSWQLGHKFLRLDMQSSQQGWSFHLGSIGCQSASRMRQPLQPCAQPNRIELDLAVPTGKQLVMDLDVLLSNIDLKEMRSCMFQAPDLPSCETLLSNLHSLPVVSWQ